jgi:hypothetical protein
MAAVNPKPQSRFWRVTRRLFRWFRITILLAILALLVLAIWLNHYGLPDMMKDPLVAALRSRGVELQFSRMRLVWYRGLVAENIHFGKRGEPRGPRASADEAELHLHFTSLLRGKLDIEGVALRDGHMVLPIWGTNATPQELNVHKLRGELRFLPNDEWQLSDFHAEAFGVNLILNGSVANASAIQQWKFLSEKPKGRTPQALWYDLVRDFEETKFEAPTEIRGIVSGDARELQSFRANLKITSPGIDSPWGKGKGVNLSAQITPQPGELIHAEIKLAAQAADTRWGRAASVQLEMQLTPSLTQWTPTNAHLALDVKRAETHWGSASALIIQADFQPNPSDASSSLVDYSIRGQQIQTPWARFARAELAANGVVSSSNAWPHSATTKLTFAGGEVGWGRAAAGSLTATLALAPLADMQFGDTNVSWWTRLDRVSGNVAAQIADAHSEKLDSKNISLQASWHTPLLTVQELDAAVYDGSIRGSATLDSKTRLLSAAIRTDFDPKLATNLIGSNVLQRLASFEWKQSPVLDFDADVMLPPWTNASGATTWNDVRWREEVLPTFSLAGNFQFGAATVGGVPVNSAQSDVLYSNRTWRLPNLLIVRPEGSAHISHVSREREGDFQFVIDSTIDPRALKPLLPIHGQKELDQLGVTVPPHVHAEIAGEWTKLEKTSMRARVAATNISFRAQPYVSCRTVMTLTNQVLTFVSPEVVRIEGVGRADSVVFDVPKLKLYINNGTGALDPAAVTKTVHPFVADMMKPYRFVSAPQAHVWGVVDLKDERGSDMHFDLAGGPFEWDWLHFQQITGHVHWTGATVTISNIAGSLHGGRLEGSLKLDFSVKEGADFAFRILVHDINLHTLVRDLGTSNRMEGVLAGLLVVTNANTERKQSWFGFGNMTLQDGLIWEVPVFGLFSPLVNAIKPGSGNNKAKEATATFVITNSAIATSDLRIDASGMRLNYDGAVDFDTHINGRMEAELFRNTPGVGPWVSKMFWPMTKIFEYKVTGTFSKPKAEPLFIPKILLMPFHPLRSIRELMESDKDDNAFPR